VVFLIRFLAGKWKSMRVIEKKSAALPHSIQPVPTLETELG